MKKKMKPETKEKIKRVAEGLLIGCTSAASVLGIAIVVNSIGSKSANKKAPMYVQFAGKQADRTVHMRVLDNKGEKIVGMGTSVENAKKTFEQLKEAIEIAEA